MLPLMIIKNHGGKSGKRKMLTAVQLQNPNEIYLLKKGRLPALFFRNFLIKISNNFYP